MPPSPVSHCSLALAVLLGCAAMSGEVAVARPDRVEMDATVTGRASDRSDGARPVGFPIAATDPILHTDPQKRSRPCLCQFGVGLPTGMAGYKIGQLLEPGDYGHHSYGGPGPSEKNGQVYTCAAGFVDSTHVRAGADWTGHLAVTLDRLTRTGGAHRYEPEGGGVRLVVRKSGQPLDREDLLRLAQRIAYERLFWHEIMSWYYHPPVRTFSEQQSTFSPEDVPSNFLGTLVGRDALGLVEASGMTFEDAVDVAFADRMNALGVVETSADTRAAFAAVDRHQDGPGNGVAWYDSSVVFFDQRYLFKRHVQALETVQPWLVPAGATPRCDRDIEPFVGHVPQTTAAGLPLTDLYQWQFTPDDEYFVPRPGALQHGEPRPAPTPLKSHITNLDLPAELEIVKRQLRVELGEGFDDPGAPPHVPADDSDRRLVPTLVQ